MSVLEIDLIEKYFVLSGLRVGDMSARETVMKPSLFMPNSAMATRCYRAGDAFYIGGID